MEPLTIVVPREADALPHSTVSPEATRARALDALYAAGHWLLTRERVLDAASVFRGMLVLAPEDERGWLALGACHEALEQTDLALDIYGAAQALKPSRVRIRLARARALEKAGREDEAEDARVAAEEVAMVAGDESLLALVAAERAAS
jgi:tetratricopeptide (TPR) repeat protein